MTNLLELSVVKRTEKEVSFMIDKQSKKIKSDMIFLSGGICFQSIAHPQWAKKEKTLFLRGSETSSNREIVTVSSKDWDIIQNAVEGFNKTYGPLLNSKNKQHIIQRLWHGTYMYFGPGFLGDRKNDIDVTYSFCKGEFERKTGIKLKVGETAVMTFKKI